MKTLTLAVSLGFFIIGLLFATSSFLNSEFAFQHKDKPAMEITVAIVLAILIFISMLGFHQLVKRAVLIRHYNPDEAVKKKQGGKGK